MSASAIARSWIANANSWRDAVREGRIASRRVATDAAIIDAVTSLQPQNVLDLGCGEGWLVRELASRGIRGCGVDGSGPLIEAAQQAGGGSFYELSYEQLITSDLPGPFDVAVANFSILDQDVSSLLNAAARMIRNEGALVIQTIHPAFGTGDHAYVSGWRTETFAAIEGTWPEPMPWYFRTMSDWLQVLTEHGYTIAEMREPMDAENIRPLSLILICRLVTTHSRS